MELIVNGERHEAQDGVTVAGLLAEYHLPEVRVAVEVNHEIVPRKSYGETVLRAGDKVEIVTFVGGG